VLPGKVLRGYAISGDTPRDQAIKNMYQKYLGARDIAELPVNVAVGFIALGSAKYLLDHPAELEAEINRMETSERARKEKYPDIPL